MTWIGHLEAQEASGSSRLTAAGNRDLDAREIQADAAFPLTHIVADDELNGGYIPFVHYTAGDTVTLHTGTGAHDYNNFGINVAAVGIVHDEAGNWFGVPELGSEYLSASSKAFEDRANRIIQQARAHTHPEMLCRTGTEGTSSATRLYLTNDSAIGTPPSFDAAWESSTAAKFALATAPSDSVNGGTDQTAGDINHDVALYQGTFLIDAAMAATLAAGGATVRAQLRARARHGIGINEAVQDHISQIVVRVTEGSATTIRGTALAAHGLTSSAGSAKWPAQSTYVNRVFPPAAASNVLSAVPGTAAGDRLVVEIGYRTFNDAATPHGGGIWVRDSSTTDDLPEDESTSTNLNSWLEISTTGTGATAAELPLDTVRQGEEAVGTSMRVTRCDHQHAHGLLSADADQYHDVTQVSGVPALSDEIPLVESGSGSAGTSDEASRRDHVHPAASGGSGGWTQGINEDGSSFANFTAASGTWASDGTIITQSDLTKTQRRVRYNTKLPIGASVVIEAEMRFPSAGQATTTLRRAGLMIGYDGANGTNAIAVYLEEDTDTINVEREAISETRQITATIAQDTYYKLRLVTTGFYVSIYLDGTLLGTTLGISQEETADYVGLYTYGALVNYRNIKAWTVTLPA